MAYADGLLAQGERIFHREKQHPWVFVWGARYTILAVIIAVVLGILSTALDTSGVSGTFRTLITWVVAVLFIGGLALLFWTTLRYLNQEYVLTNRRVLQVEGVVNKRVVDSSLEKINDAVLTQSIFGRALGFGDLKVLTASEAAISDFRMIRRPIEFKKAMLDAKYEYEREIAGTVDPGPPLRSEPLAPPSAPTPPAPIAPVPAAPIAPVAPPAAAGPPPVAPPPAAAAAAATAAAAPAWAPTSPPGSPVSDDTVVTPTPTPSVSGSPEPPAAATSDDLARTLADLADLRDRGAITAEEYERSKAEILGRL